MNLNFSKNKVPIVLVFAAVLLAVAGFYFQQQAASITGAVISKPSDDKIVLAWSRFGLAFAPVVIAKEKGFWTEQGLDVDVVPFTSGKDALDAVIAGKADASTNADTPIVFAVLRGEDRFAIVSGVAKTKSWVVANKDSGISNESDLKGKKLATRLGTTGEYFMHNFLRAHGITPAEVSIQSLDLPVAPIALDKREVDAIFYWQTVPYYAQRALGDRAVVFKPDFPNEVLFIVFSKDFAVQKPEVVKKFLKGLVKAVDFIRSNEAEALEINSKVHNIPVADLKEIWPDFNLEISLKQAALDYLSNEAAWAMEAGKAPKNASKPDFCSFVFSQPLKAIASEKVSINC